MNTLSYKTISVNKETAKKEWVVVDASDQIVGRLCSKVAKLLRGKYKPTFTPHVDCGDNVITRLSSLARKRLTRSTHVILVIPVASASTLPQSCASARAVSTRSSVTPLRVCSPRVL